MTLSKSLDLCGFQLPPVSEKGMADSENTRGVPAQLLGISRCKAPNSECQVHSKSPVNVAKNAEIACHHLSSYP